MRGSENGGKGNDAGFKNGLWQRHGFTLALPNAPKTVGFSP